jgi:hypothetical protein
VTADSLYEAVVVLGITEVAGIRTPKDAGRWLIAIA